MRGLIPLLLLVIGSAARGDAAPPPWQRTESRQPCDGTDPLRQPFFGDLHIHTRYSADAYIFGNPRRTARRVRFRAGSGRAPAGRRRRSPDAPVASHRSSPRLRGRHRPRGVLRRGRSVLDRRARWCSTIRCAASSAARAGPERPVRGHGRLAVPGRHPEPAAVARLLLRFPASTATPRPFRSGRRSRPRPRRPTIAPPRAPSPPSSATSTPPARSAATCTATSSSATSTCRHSRRAISRPSPAVCRRASGRPSRPSASTPARAATP